MVLYDITDKHPEILGDVNEEDRYTDADLAAANYITTVSKNFVKYEGDTHYSEYDEIVDKIIKAYPNAVRLIISLRQINDIAELATKNAYDLVEDYLTGNFEKSHNNSFDNNSERRINI